jgi:hypothetical protein
MRLFLITIAAILFLAAPALAESKKILVFVALCDNDSQAIVPVAKALGNGDDPEKNLYWGSGEGFKTVFDKSPHWKLSSKIDKAADDVLRQRTYEAKDGTATIEAKAYRGTAMKQCLQDFEAALQADTHDLVIFVGHNGLMDFDLPAAKPKEKKRQVHAMVLCCKSEEYFAERLKAVSAKPMLLTTQLMYPGSFLVDAAVRQWLQAAAPADIRDAAASAYAENQKITKKSALGIFSRL